MKLLIYVFLLAVFASSSISVYAYDPSSPMNITVKLNVDTFTLNSDPLSKYTYGGVVASLSPSIAELSLIDSFGHVALNLSAISSSYPAYCQLSFVATDVQPWDPDQPEKWDAVPQLRMAWCINAKAHVSRESEFTFTVKAIVAPGEFCEWRSADHPCVPISMTTNVAAVGVDVDVTGEEVRRIALFAVDEINKKSNSVVKFHLIKVMAADRSLSHTHLKYSLQMLLGLGVRHTEQHLVVVHDERTGLRLAEHKICHNDDCSSAEDSSPLAVNDPVNTTSEEVLRIADFAVVEINKKSNSLVKFHLNAVLTADRRLITYDLEYTLDMSLSRGDAQDRKSVV